MLNRREILYSTAAAALASVTPSIALASPDAIAPNADRIRELAESRLFSFEPGAGPRLSFLLRTKYPVPESDYQLFYEPNQLFSSKGDTIPEMCFMLEKRTTDSSVRLGSSVRATEIQYILNCPRTYSEEYIDTFATPTNPSSKWPSSIFEIARAQNRVAKSTRRGRARWLIASPKTASFLKQWEDVITYQPERIFEDDILNDNQVFVYYRGTSRFDVAGVLFEDGSVALNRNQKDDSFSYGQLIIFKEKHVTS